jgi:imidazolonepropionase
MKEAGVDIAIATDYNPGSCNIQSMPFIITLSCIYLQMDILEAIKSSTYIAAKSLMLEKTIGSIEIGKKADIVVWNLSRIEEIPYFINKQKISSVLKNGKPVFTA